jgi:phage shock protein A
MNTDEKIAKMLEDLHPGQQALQADVTAIKGEVAKIPAIATQLEQHGKILTGLAAAVGTVIEEQQAQRLDIRSLHTGLQSLHTEVRASKEELKSEILAARAEAKMDTVDVKATVIRQLKGHESRIDALEDAAEIPHPDKN